MTRLTLLLAMALLLTACGPSEELTQAQADLVEAQSDLSNTLSELSSLQTEYDQLSQDFDELLAGVLCPDFGGVTPDYSSNEAASAWLANYHATVREQNVLQNSFDVPFWEDSLATIHTIDTEDFLYLYMVYFEETSDGFTSYNGIFDLGAECWLDSQ